jgi:hypothetical protein
MDLNEMMDFVEALRDPSDPSFPHESDLSFLFGQYYIDRIVAVLITRIL